MKKYNFLRITLLLILAFQIKLASAVDVPASGSSSITVCSGTVYDNGGTSTYSNNTNGSLTINPGTAGSKIQLNFTSFATESGYDYLYIYDGTSASATLLGTYMGTTSPGVITATSSNTSGALTLVFVTDNSNVLSGFEATISCVTSASVVVPYSGATSTTACSGTVTDHAGTGNYSTYASGSLTINPGTAGSMVQLNFSTFNLEGCCDYVYIYDGTSTSSTLIGTYGGTTNPGTVTASNTSGALTIRFTTDGSGNYQGFAATISCVPFSGIANVPYSGTSSITTCSGTLYDHAGNSNYSTYANGTLTINPGTIGNKVQLNFSTFYLENCCDYLYIYDGTSTSATLLGTYGGTTSPGIVTATNSNTSGALTVRFTSDGSYSYSGFAATISCISVATPTIAVSPTSVSASINSCTGTATQNVTINNTGVGSANWQVVSLSKSDDFDPAVDNSVWQTITGGVASSSCGSVSGLALYFDGGTREAITNPINTTSGGTVNFSLKIGQGVYPCEQADSGEDVILYYSTNNGSTWTILQTYYAGTTYANFTNISATIPAAAQTSSTLFRWAQPNNSGSSTDNWAIDNVSINAVGTGWLTATPSTGTTIAGGSSTIAVQFQATGLSTGTYTSQLTLSSNDPANPTIIIPVTLTVSNCAPVIDLIVNTPTVAPTSLVAGSSVSVSSTVYNQGNTITSTNNVGYYLSTNTTYDAADIYLGNSSVGALSGATGSNISSTITIPSGTTAGTYYLLFRADYNGVITESNETNNVSYATITITAATVDLVVTTQYTSASSAAAGTSVYAYAYVYNQGNSTASSSYLGYYLSTNTVYDASDIYLTNYYVGSLSASGSYSTSSSITIPTGTAPGTYYIIFRADNNSTVTESNEANNVSYSSITVITPSVDLAVTSPYSSSSVIAGNSVSVSSYVYNYGNTIASSSYVGYYLSTNTVYDASDVYLGNSYVSSVSASSSTYASSTVTIPAGTTVGTYYIIFRADNNATIVETNENNNVNYSSITVTSPSVDLTVTSPYSSSSVIAGNSAYVYSYVNNTGNTLASASYLGYYLSTNAVYDASDIYLGNSSVNSISASSSSYVTTYVTIPVGTTAGTYYIIFRADNNATISETNENNNTNYASITVTSGTIDLYVSSQYVSPTSVVAGNSVNVSGYLYNSGNVASGSSNIGYYLSTNTVFDASDIYVNSDYISNVSASSSSYFSRSLPIPNGIPAGFYYLLFRADNDATVTESNENNNVSYGSLTVTAPPVDLNITSQSITLSTVQAGSYTNSSCTITNTGTTTASSSNVGYYLSIDQAFDPASDVYLSNSTGSSLSAGSSQTKNATLVIPSTTTGGNYYILFVADYSGLVTETQESNNVASSPITITPLTGIMNSIEENVTVSPNPNEGRFTISANDLGSNKLAITIYSPLGVEVKHITDAKMSNSIDLTGYSAGIYLVKVQVGANQKIYRVTVQ